MIQMGKLLILKVWFSIPRMIKEYQFKNCTNYIPDVMQHNGEVGTKVRTIFGYMLQVDEGRLVHWRWWRNIKKV